MTTPATAAALLLLAVLSVCASARTVPQQDSVWTHLMRAWAPARPTQQQLAAPVSGYALYDEATGRFTFTHKEPNSGPAPAHATYSHWSNHGSGFGQLRVTTHAAYSNQVQMQAAGFVEGYLTAPDIFNHWYNQRWWLSQNTNDTYKVMNWLMQHDSWLQQQLADPANQGSPFWQAMQLVMVQLWGMRDGYNARVSAEGAALGIDFISQREWLTLNTMGDMDDLLELLFPDDPQLGAAHLADMEPAALRAHLATRGRCSALVKVAPDFSNIFIGHATWWTYTSMLRVYKHYTFELQGEQYKTRTTSMSSYPGMITSMDDFYILSGSHLVVTETSNDILDPDVWQQVVPQAALSWQRVLVANWLSSSGKEWAHWIKQHNSGTYNNQYIVVDLKRFTPGAELQEGLLTVVEQMPGLVMHGDKTQALERGYWPSYNIPYFAEIYNKSGYPSLSDSLRSKDEAAYSAVLSGLSYQLAPRAKISRRDQGGVLGMAQLKAYMRSNSWASEPYSGSSPFGAICSRGDLDPSHPKASGCNDAKVTSYSLAMANAAEAVSGPTAGDAGALGVFKWGGQWEGVAHRGQPDVFDFDFELQKP